MRTKTATFILLVASALIVSAISPLPALAQSSCSSYASLAVTSPKISYQVGETFSGEIVLTNNIGAADVNFNINVTKSGQSILTKSYTLATQLGRNVYTLKDALGLDTFPGPGIYNIAVIASHSSTGCSWNVSLGLWVLLIAPQIQSLNPTSALPGVNVTITGTGFTPTGNDVKSSSAIIASNISSSDGKTLVFTVPSVSSGGYPISVSNSGGVSNEIVFQVLSDKPYLDSLVPDTGAPGTQITVNGGNFASIGNDLKSGQTVVVSALLSSDSKTITFFIPESTPAGTYQIYIQNSKGATNEKTLTVLAIKPEIESLTPDSALPGTEITIKGKGFLTSGNAVKSGSTLVAGGLASSDEKTLVFTVPDVSPGQYPIIVFNWRGVSNEKTLTVTPVKLLSSLIISPKEYLLAQTVTGSVALTNPTAKEIKANFSIELYKDAALFWQRQINDVSIPPSLGPAPKVISFSLDDVFGFKPTIPEEPSFVGNWKLLIKRTDTGPTAVPDDSVSQNFTIKAPIVQPLTLTFAFDPKEYLLGDTLKGKGTVVNLGSSPVKADFKIELFQGTTLKWQREIKALSIPRGTANFTVDNLFGSKVVIPDKVAFIGDWKLKISQLGTTPEVSVEAIFKIQSLTAACKPTTGTPASKAFGIVQGFFPWSTSPKYLDYMKELGVKWARLELPWPQIEPQKGQFNWEFYDKVVKTFEENNIQILGQFGNAPCWANGRPCPFQNPFEHSYPPTDSDAWSNFVKKAAERYKPGGTLGLKTGITHWEIWNEPNIDLFWRPQPDAKKYADLLAVSNRAIREVDPKAIIVGGALAGTPPDFLDDIYKTGAKNCFDAVSFHPYGKVSELKPKTEAIKKFLVDHQDANKPIWYTEYGFVTGKSGEPGPVGSKVSEQEQAQYVKETYDLFKQGIINNLFWISLVDFDPGPEGGDFGLLRLDYSKKPAFDVLKNLLNPPPPTAGISINVDASKEGRNIARLKKGHNSLGFIPSSNNPFYQKEIGYDENTLVRLHDPWRFANEDKEIFRQRIVDISGVGKPDFMFDIAGTPKRLASKFQDDVSERYGCLQKWATTPPKDYNEWKNYVKEWVIFLKPFNIKYWEIWNEPNDGQYPGCFWSGTQDDFFKVYKATAEAIREAYGGTLPAGVKIGGPALTAFDSGIYGSGENLAISLPKFARENNLPLDFFSWHDYSNSPSFLKENNVITRIKSELQKNGFSQTELIIDEYALADSPWRNYKRATLIAATLTTMAKTNLDRQSLFSFVDDTNPTKYYAWGLFGIVDNIIIKPEFNFFKAISRMGNVMIDVSAQPSAVADYVLATKSSDRISVMVVNYQDVKVSIPLTVKNVPQNFTKLTKYIINATHSNAYAVEAKIKTRMDQGKAQAAPQAKESFKTSLRQKGYGEFVILIASNFFDKYIINNNDPDVKTWLEQLTPQQKQDVLDDFSQAMSAYNAKIESVADEINNWPEVKLYSETKNVSIPASGIYQEALALEPYAVQVIMLSN